MHCHNHSFVNALVNGELQTSINLEDRALHYGDGLFETMLYQHGNIPLWSQHFTRLSRGCEVLGLKLMSENTLLNELKALTKELKGDSYIFKLILTRGAAGRGLRLDKKIMTSRILLAYDFDINALLSKSAQKLKICHTHLLINKTLGGIKHLNRLLYVLAANELDEHYSEGIMLNDHDEMIECITHNLFFVKDNTLYTAPIDNCGVAGIKRQQVLDSAKTLGISVKIQAILVNELEQMDECFITNAVVGLQSVQSIEQIIFSQYSMMHQLQNSI